MYVGGTVISSVEFHGNMSLVIFMSKCPLACRYCHNAELLDDNTQLSFEEIKKYRHSLVEQRYLSQSYLLCLLSFV